MGAAPNIPENPLLNKELIQAFIKSVTETLSTMANTNVTVGKPVIEKSSQINGEIMGLIGMVAPPLKGKLIISFPKKTILTVMHNMLGEQHTEITPEVTDAVGELTNMIYGSAKTTLNSLGYKFEMAIPTVIEGKVKLSIIGAGPTLTIPFKTANNDDFFIEMAIN